MTFSHCKATAKISLVIFPIAVNISKRYPLDIFFYLERKCNECDNCIICGCTCNIVDNNNNKRDRKCNDECPPHKCKKLVFEDTRNNDDSVSVDLQDTSNIIKDILHILRMEPDSSLITHLPSKKIKSELSTWNDNSLEAKDARTRVLNVYKEFLRRFAVALVGEIAAERSVEKAIEDMKKTKAHKDMVAAARKKLEEAKKKPMIKIQVPEKKLGYKVLLLFFFKLNHRNQMV